MVKTAGRDEVLGVDRSLGRGRSDEQRRLRRAGADAHRRRRLVESVLFEVARVGHDRLHLRAGDRADQAVDRAELRSALTAPGNCHSPFFFSNLSVLRRRQLDDVDLSRSTFRTALSRRSNVAIERGLEE